MGHGAVNEYCRVNSRTAAQAYQSATARFIHGRKLVGENANQWFLSKPPRKTPATREDTAWPRWPLLAGGRPIAARGIGWRAPLSFRPGACGAFRRLLSQSLSILFGKGGQTIPINVQRRDGGRIFDYWCNGWMNTVARTLRRPRWAAQSRMRVTCIETNFHSPLDRWATWVANMRATSPSPLRPKRRVRGPVITATSSPKKRIKGRRGSVSRGNFRTLAANSSRESARPLP